MLSHLRAHALRFTILAAGAIVLAGLFALASITAASPEAGRTADAAHADQVTDAANGRLQAHAATFTIPCESEESIGCVFHAPSQDNGMGLSYWSDLEGNYVQLAHDDARDMLTGKLDPMDTSIRTEPMPYDR